MGAVTICVMVNMNRVCPSGLARATYSAAIRPPAPLRFSTMNGLPMRWLSFSAMRRAIRSVLPPGENGTTIVTGRFGQFPSARAANGALASKPIAPSPKRRLTGLKGGVMLSPL